MRYERPGLTADFWVGIANTLAFIAALLLSLMVGFL